MIKVVIRTAVTWPTAT